MPGTADSPSLGEDEQTARCRLPQGPLREWSARRAPWGRGSAWVWLARSSRSWPWWSARHPGVGILPSGDRVHRIRRTATKDQTIRVTAVFTSSIPTSTSALPASAAVTRSCSPATFEKRRAGGSGRGGLHLCVHRMRPGSRPSAPRPRSWLGGNHYPGHDRQPVAQLHAADHRWLGSLSGRRRASGLSRHLDPDPPRSS